MIIDNETERKWLGSICISWYSSRRYMAVILSIRCPKQSINQSINQIILNYFFSFIFFKYICIMYISYVWFTGNIYANICVNLFLIIVLFVCFLFCFFFFWLVCLLLILNENIMKCRIITHKNNWLIWQ